MAKAVYDLNTWKYVGWGTGTTTAAKAATVCETEAGETSTTKVTGVLTSNTVTTTNDQLQVVATITCQTTAKTIANAGLFNTSTTGLMEYGTFTGIPLSVADSIQFTFLLQVT
jgi:hypothetical protein